MTIELLYFDGCPNHEPLLPKLRQLIEQTRAEDELRLVRIDSPEDAERQGFLGSPTVRVDGVDVEPGADARDDFGMKCRLYHRPDGLRGSPAEEWVLSALEGHGDSDRAA